MIWGSWKVTFFWCLPCPVQRNPASWGTSLHGISGADGYATAHLNLSSGHVPCSQLFMLVDDHIPYRSHGVLRCDVSKNEQDQMRYGCQMSSKYRGTCQISPWIANMSRYPLDPARVGWHSWTRKSFPPWRPIHSKFRWTQLLSKIYLSSVQNILVASELGSQYIE